MSRGFEELLRTREEFEESKAVVCVFGAMSRASSKEQRKAAASPGIAAGHRSAQCLYGVWRMTTGAWAGGQRAGAGGREARGIFAFAFAAQACRSVECIRRVYIPLDIPIYQNFAKAKAKRKARWHVSGPSVVRQQWR